MGNAHSTGVRHMALITVVETARKLNVSPATVYQLCATHRLPHLRIGSGRGAIRIEERDLQNFLDSCKISRATQGTMKLKHIRHRV